MTDDKGLATRPWVSWFTWVQPLFNQIIQAAGIAQPQEPALNFEAPFIVTDDPANGATNISLPAATYSIQFGSAEANATGNDFSTVDVVFPSAFSAAPKVFVNAASFPRTGNTPMTCFATDISATGFTANLACAVPTGGGGATIDNQITVDWVAIG